MTLNFARKVLAPIVLLAAAITAMAIFVLAEQTFRRQSWATVEAKVLNIGQGCVVSYLPASGLLRADGAIVPCDASPNSLPMPEGAKKPLIKRGLVGRLDYVAAGHQVTREGFLGGIADEAKVGDTVTVLSAPLNPLHLEYAGALKGLTGGLAIIAFGLVFCGSYFWFLWIRPFIKGSGPGSPLVSGTGHAARESGAVQRGQPKGFGRRS
jgi:hypothetical protein